jgi:transcriptional regulator with XRE-family HTH domain
MTRTTAGVAAWPATSQRRAPRIVRAADPNARLHVECRCGEPTGCGALEPLPVACQRCGERLRSCLPDRLLALRRLRGIEQREVAARIHVHDSVFALWEAGKRAVPARWIEPLAAALEVPLQLLAHDADLSMALFDVEDGVGPGGDEATSVEVDAAGQPQAMAEPAGCEEPASRGSEVPTDLGGRRAVYTIEVSCLMCGQAIGELISALLPLPPVVVFQPSGGLRQRAVVWHRLRCGTCGGNSWLGDVQRRWAYPALDWSSDPPRRGRPPRRPPQADARPRGGPGQAA